MRDGANWEVGRGTYTTSGTTLSRGSLYSSDAGAAITATANAIVWIAVLAEDLALGPPAVSLTANGTTNATTLTLSARYNEIGTCTATNNAGILATPQPGNSDNSVQTLVPRRFFCSLNSGAQFNSAGANIAIGIASGSLMRFYPFSATQWYTATRSGLGLSRCRRRTRTMVRRRLRFFPRSLALRPIQVGSGAAGDGTARAILGCSGIPSKGGFAAK